MPAVHKRPLVHRLARLLVRLRASPPGSSRSSALQVRHHPTLYPLVSLYRPPHLLIQVVFAVIFPLLSNQPHLLGPRLFDRPVLAILVAAPIPALLMAL